MPATRVKRHWLFAPLAAIFIASPGAFAQTLDWHKFTGATSPSKRAAAGMAYDAARKQVVLFGGAGSGGDETWVWDGTSWSQKFPTSHPSSRHSSAMAYDELHKQVVLFGGASGDDETWIWDGSNWTELHPAHSPLGRQQSAMAYDAERKQMVLFGGVHVTPLVASFLGDTWTWDGTDWTQRSPANAPGARKQSAIAYDAGHKQTVLYGGNTGDTQTWLWDGTNWTAKSTSPNPGPANASRMSYDDSLSVAVMTGDIGQSGTWTWDGAAWTQLSTATSPLAVDDHSMAYDSDAGHTVMFGGFNSVLGFTNETWLLYAPKINVTITSATSGATFSVTGTTCQPGTGYTVPKTLQWTSGSSCSVSFTSPVSGSSGTQFVFTNWNDSNTSNPRSFVVPASATTYTANYKTQYQLITAISPSGAGTVTGAGFYDANTNAAVTATATPGYQFTGWSPALSPNTASSTVAMTGPKTVSANFAIVTGTTAAPATGQYSDPVTLSATIAPAGAVFSGSLQFQIDGVNAGAAIPVSGAGTYTTSYTITVPSGPHTITAVLTPSTTIALGSTGTSTLTVTKEDASITLDPTNPQAVPTGPATLKATIAQAADGSLGDITKAAVTLTLVPVIGTGNINCPVTNAAGALTASCPTLPVNVYNVQWAIGGNYFTGPTVSAKLGVTSPTLGFVNGTGSVVINGIRSDFSAYLLNQGSGLQGGLQFTQHQPTGDVTVATTSLISVSVVGKTAVLLARATINGAGDFPLQAILTDNVAQPVVTRDQFGLQAGSISFAPVAIAFGGDIQVN